MMRPGFIETIDPILRIISPEIGRRWARQTGDKVVLHGKLIPRLSRRYKIGWVWR